MILLFSFICLIVAVFSYMAGAAAMKKEMQEEKHNKLNNAFLFRDQPNYVKPSSALIKK